MWFWQPSAPEEIEGPHKIVLSASANIAAGAATATTAQLTAPAGKNSGVDFQAGSISDDTNPLPSINLGSDAYTELEWCMKAVAGLVADGDVCQFKIMTGTGPLDTITVTPQWTILSFSGRPAWGVIAFRTDQATDPVFTE